MFLPFDRRKEKREEMQESCTYTSWRRRNLIVKSRKETVAEEGRRRSRKKRKIINGSFYENHKFLTPTVCPIKYPRFSWLLSWSRCVLCMLRVIYHRNIHLYFITRNISSSFQDWNRMVSLVYQNVIRASLNFLMKREYR